MGSEEAYGAYLVRVLLMFFNVREHYINTILENVGLVALILGILCSQPVSQSSYVTGINTFGSKFDTLFQYPVDTSTFTDTIFHG